MENLRYECLNCGRIHEYGHDKSAVLHRYIRVSYDMRFYYKLAPTLLSEILSKEAKCCDKPALGIFLD